MDRQDYDSKPFIDCTVNASQYARFGPRLEDTSYPESRPHILKCPEDFTRYHIPRSPVHIPGVYSTNNAYRSKIKVCT